MPIGSSLGVTLPTQGSTTTWGTALNTELQKIIDAVEANVPSGAITFSADFDFNNYAVTSLAHATFDGQGTPPTELRTVYFDSSGELNIVDGAGNDFAITSGGGLSGAGGSITGAGYGSSGVELNWVSANTRYDFKSGAGADSFADIKFSSALLNDGSGNTITLGAPSISSNYTLTFPTAVPGNTSLITMSSAGALATTRDPSIDTVTTSGNATVGGTATANALTTTTSATIGTTLDVTGAATFYGSLIGTTVAITGKYTTSGSYYSFATNDTMHISAAAACSTGTGGSYHATEASYNSGSSSDDVVVPIQVTAKDRIDGYSIWVKPGALGGLSVALYYGTSSAAETLIGAGTSTGSGTAWVNLSESSLAHDVSGNRHYYLRISPTGSSAVSVSTTKITYSRP